MKKKKTKIPDKFEDTRDGKRRPWKLGNSERILDKEINKLGKNAKQTQEWSDGQEIRMVGSPSQRHRKKESGED